MENRFKFRVWDKFNKQMIYPENDAWKYALTQDGKLICEADFQGNPLGEIIYERCNMEYLEVMFFLGLPDKNDKPIYEGDIIDCFHFYPIQRITGITIFDKKSSAFGIKDLKNKSRSTLWLDEDCDEKEIIGNKFENPNLLGE